MTEVTEQPVATDEGNPSIASRMVSTIFRWLKLLCFAIGLGLIVIIGFLLIRGESADDVSTEQVAEASQPVAAPKPLDC